MRKFLLVLMALFLMTNQAFAQVNQWRAGTGENSIIGGENASDIDAASYYHIVSPLDRLLSSYREGCAISYSSASSITIGTGQLTVSNSDGSIRFMVNNTSTTSVTFSDIDTGSEAASTTYYVWAYCSAITDTTFSIKLSTSSTAPSGLTYYRRLGSIYNDSSSNIEASKVTNDNNYYALKVGDAVAKTADVEYTASTDGLVAGSVFWSTNSHAYLTIETPTGTARQKAGSYPYGNYDYAAFCYPVQKGKTYKAVSTGGITVSYYWFIPLQGDL